MWTSKKAAPTIVLLLLVVVVVPASAVDSDAGNGVKGIMTCMDKMLPCQAYIHARKPLSEMCCNLLQQMIEGDPSCPCAIYQSDAILKTINLTREEALRIPVTCGHGPPNLTRCENVKVTSLAQATPTTTTTTSASITTAPTAKAADNVLVLRTATTTANVGTTPSMNTFVFFALLLVSLLSAISPSCL